MESLDILTEDFDVIPKTINSDLDFISITCPEHGLYYKSVHDIKRQNIDCPRCQFLNPSRMMNYLQRAQSEIEKLEDGLTDWSAFFKRYRRDAEIFDVPAMYYRLHITHKETGFEFQRIGVLSKFDEKSSKDLQKDFNDFWCPFKWKSFKIEAIDKIECTYLEANIMEGLYQREHADLKITLLNELGFNLNKTYLPDFITQARSKTVKVLRETLLMRQKGNCTVCGKPVKAPTLDHEHIKKIRGTGFIRGTICSNCNTYLARIENNAARHGLNLRELPQTLRRIALYLEDQKQIIHPTEVPKRKKVGAREWNRVKKYYFEVFSGRKNLPKRPTYVTDKWLILKRQVDEYIERKKDKK